jgi:hypothetical protein
MLLIGRRLQARFGRGEIKRKCIAIQTEHSRGGWQRRLGYTSLVISERIRVVTVQIWVYT